MATSIGIVPNTTDPTNTLQLQFYTVNAKVVNEFTSIAALAQEILNINAEIASLQSTVAAKQTTYTNIVNYLTSIGVTDITKPLTQAQITSLTSAGYVTTPV